MKTKYIRKEKMLGVQITDDINNQLKECAMKEETNVSTIVRKAIKEYLKKNETA